VWFIVAVNAKCEQGSHLSCRSIHQRPNDQDNTNLTRGQQSQHLFFNESTKQQTQDQQ
jgi:hypothetical protein